MHDLSHTGCRLELPESTVELGGTAVVDLPGAIRVAGRVVWIRGHQAGVQFERAVRGAAAVALGLDDPEPEPVAEPEPVQGGMQGLLRHWIRRLTGRKR